MLLTRIFFICSSHDIGQFGVSLNASITIFSEFSSKKPFTLGRYFIYAVGRCSTLLKVDVKILHFQRAAQYFPEISTGCNPRGFSFWENISAFGTWFFTGKSNKDIFLEKIDWTTEKLFFSNNRIKTTLRSSESLTCVLFQE